MAEFPLWLKQSQLWCNPKIQGTVYTRFFLSVISDGRRGELVVGGWSWDPERGPPEEACSRHCLSPPCQQRALVPGGGKVFFRLSIFLLLLCNQVPCSLLYLMKSHTAWLAEYHGVWYSIQPTFPVPSFLATGTPPARIKSGEVFLGPSSHKGRLGTFSKEAGGLFYRGSLPTTVSLLLLFILLPG